MENQVTPYVDLGTQIGRNQAFGVVASKSAMAQAQILAEIRESESYKLLGLTFEEFCNSHVGLSLRTVESIIHNLKEFGETYHRLSEIVRISPETYRLLAGKIQDQQIEIDGEMLPIVSENAIRIREAVYRLRAELRLAQHEVRQAQEDVRKANDAAAGLASPDVISLQTRLDACFVDMRRIFPSLAVKHEDAPIRGLVTYAIERLRDLARYFG